MSSVVAPVVAQNGAQASQSGKSLRLDFPPNMLADAKQQAPALPLPDQKEGISPGQLAQYVRLVLDRHPTLLQSEAQSRAVDYRVAEAKGGRYPQLVLRGDLGRERRDQPMSSQSDLNLAQVQARVVMPMYDPTVNAKIAQRESVAVGAGWQLTNVREQLILQTVEAYVELVRASRMLTMAQESLKAHRQYAAQIKEKMHNAAEAVTDMPAATARVARSESTLPLYLRRLEMARTTWWKLTGLGAHNQALDVPFADLSSTLDGVLEQAYRENAMVKWVEASIDQAQKTVDIERASYKPHANFEVRSGTGRDWDGLSGRQSRNYAGVTVEWKAFSGFSDAYVNKAAQEEVRAAQYAFDEARQMLRVRVEQEWFDLQSGEAALQSYQAYVQDAQMMVSTSQKRFAQGKTTLLEVLDAEKELLAARMQAESTYQDMVLSSWRLLALQGRIQSILEQ